MRETIVPRGALGVARRYRKVVPSSRRARIAHLLVLGRATVAIRAATFRSMNRRIPTAKLFPINLVDGTQRRRLILSPDLIVGRAWRNRGFA
jgi:hypothetical protein